MELHYQTKPAAAMKRLFRVRSLVGGSALLLPRYDQIMSFATSHALPTMFVYGYAARQGGLLSYGSVAGEGSRLAGAYTGRILKGEKPADLLVQLSTRFEFIINLKTARAIRLEIPPLPRVNAET